MSDYETQREGMVADQLEARGISDPRVLLAMRAVPRHCFIPSENRGHAYRDGPVPIGQDQTISQPYIVAIMAELADLAPGQTVLDVGMGSGYAAAVAAQIVSHVYAIERHAPLTRQASNVLDSLGYQNVTTRTGDGTKGWPEMAPFDAILVAAAGDVPRALCEQLKPGGRLVIPVSGPGGRQMLKRITRTGDDTWSEMDAGGVAFVPLVNEAGR
ncbi:protein-L-isoaspartate(D-aspartate) O-methyltransferase [Henriciella sp.]|uniref:protein-L-isoaspartate(D-aspartate) O-methyltransferase n=1 Tax=Henriciella sp. TaxID=1968823 RepID=UPI002629E598|nr:protein-L-isoaspartate(D-aspartate) O-methyltransferase [Henriciella sp.]